MFADGLGEPEGPVLLDDGSWLVVEMSTDRGCVTRISSDGRHCRVVARTGTPNGLAVDRHGLIWIAETKHPSLLRMTMEGTWKVWASGCAGEPFLFPNDLAFGPDGALYLTDSGIRGDELAADGRVRPEFAELRYDGRLYRIDPRTRETTKLDSGLRFANGLAFGADDSLYVNETLTGMIYRYPWREGSLGGRELFANVLDPDGPPGFTGPDGMKWSRGGELYVTVYGRSEVVVLAADGGVRRRIATEGRYPTNCAFGPAGSGRLYVTEDELGRMEVFDVGVGGLLLHG